jgi:hypothetical protein
VLADLYPAASAWHRSRRIPHRLVPLRPRLPAMAVLRSSVRASPGAAVRGFHLVRAGEGHTPCPSIRTTGATLLATERCSAGHARMAAQSRSARGLLYPLLYLTACCHYSGAMANEDVCSW